MWISAGIYPGAPSYTIWKEGSNYFAKDANGQIDYAGTNASNLLQNCINALSVSGDYRHPYHVDSYIPKIEIVSPMIINYEVTVDRPLIIDFGWQLITLNAGFNMPKQRRLLFCREAGSKSLRGLLLLL